MRALAALFALAFGLPAAAQNLTPPAPTLDGPAPVTPSGPAQGLTPPAPTLDGPSEAPAPAAPAERTGLELGFSAFGFVNGSFIDEPAENDKNVNIDGTLVKLPYSGFGGVGYGGGLGLFVGWQGIAGLEAQIIRSFDGGAGNIVYDGVRYEFEMGQMAWHVPLLLRISPPTDPVRPFIFGGPEWVFPGDATFDFSGGNVRDDWDAIAEDYQAWAFGFGLDVIIPTGGNELRVPITFKGSYNPSLGGTAEDRTDLQGCRVDRGLADCDVQAYVSEWQWQAFITVGLQYVLLL